MGSNQKLLSGAENAHVTNSFMVTKEEEFHDLMVLVISDFEKVGIEKLKFKVNVSETDIDHKRVR